MLKGRGRGSPKRIALRRDAHDVVVKRGVDGRILRGYFHRLRPRVGVPQREVLDRLVLALVHLGLDRRALECPCLLYTSPSPRDRTRSRMPSSA